MKRFFLYCMILTCICLFAGCGDDAQEPQKESSDVIRIGVKNTEEHQILGILAKILIEEKTGNAAEIVYDDNAVSASLFDSLQNGSLEMYFDYSGSVGENALSLDESDENSKALSLMELQNTLSGEYQIFLSDSLGYESRLTIYITPDLREELDGISSFSDLAAVSKKLTIGMPRSFYERIDGYAALKEAYDFKFIEASVYSEEDGFWALVHGDIDVMVGETTNIYNALYNLYLLSDDKRFFQPQYACYVVRNEVFDDYEGLKESLSIMSNFLTAGTMSSMKRKIFWEGEEAENYLHTYLRARNLI